MSDPEVATKAPESDAMEQQASALSTHNSTTRSDSSTTMGEHCTTDRPLPQSSSGNNSSQQPSGEMSRLADDSIDVYISKPADYPNSPGKLLLLLTGGTGVHSVNNQLQADRFAAEGYVVVMPDQFAGDPAPTTSSHVADHQQDGTAAAASGSSSPSFIESVKLRAAETAKAFLIDMWLARQTAEKVLPRLRKVVESVRDEYADAVANGGGIYAVGYCFGGKYVLVLAGEGAEESLAGGQETGRKGADDDEEAALSSSESRKGGPVIKAGAIAHATLVTRQDMLGIRAPVSLVCVENDQLFPEEILDVGRKHLGTTNVEHQIEVYQGVPHGFAVVGEYNDAKIRAAQVKAFDQMLDWLKAH